MPHSQGGGTGFISKPSATVSDVQGSNEKWVLSFKANTAIAQGDAVYLVASSGVAEVATLETSGLTENGVNPRIVGVYDAAENQYADAAAGDLVRITVRGPATCNVQGATDAVVVGDTLVYDATGQGMIGKATIATLASDISNFKIIALAAASTDTAIAVYVN